MDITEFTFRIQRYVVYYGLLKGVALKPERVQIDIDREQALARAIINVATQEEEVAKYPADWWQAFKERYFPKWLLWRFPVNYEAVWAVHKFPEVDLPDSVLGREFVHLKLLPVKEEKEIG